MNTKRILLTILWTYLLTLGATACSVQPGMQEARQSAAVEIATSFIVQAESADIAAQAVREAGGLVTHELSIIRAVGARLTSQQRRQLEQHDVVRRVYEDGAVTTSSACGASGAGTVFEDDKFRWLITNSGSSTVTIGSLSIAWPSVNSTLKKIKFDGADIWTAQAEPPHVQIVDGWHDDVGRRQLAPGQTATCGRTDSPNSPWALTSGWSRSSDSCFLGVRFDPRIM